MISEKSFSRYIDLMMAYREILSNMNVVLSLSEECPLLKIESSLIDLIINECEIVPEHDESNPEYWSWEPLIIKYLNYAFDKGPDNIEIVGAPEAEDEGLVVKTIPQPDEKTANSEEQIQVEPTIWHIKTNEDLYKLLVAVYQENNIIVNEE